MLKKHFTSKETLIITSPVKGFAKHEDEIVRTGLPMKVYNPIRESLKKYSFVRSMHKLFWPDDKLFHQFFYLLAYLFKYRKKDDRIITVSNPFSAHLIGMFLRKICGHRWTIDVGDVFYSYHHYSFLNRWFEKKVILNADEIIVNSESLRNHFLSLYKIPTEKIRVISNGTQLDFSKLKHIASETIRLSYIGNTYDHTREAIEEMRILIACAKRSGKKMRIQLFGNQFHKLHQLQKEHPELIQIAYCYNDEELLNAYAQTDILINFANKNNPGLPSKLEEYAVSRLPVINFVYTEADASCPYLHETKCIVCHINIEAPDMQKLIDFVLKKHQTNEHL